MESLLDPVSRLGVVVARYIEAYFPLHHFLAAQRSELPSIISFDVQSHPSQFDVQSRHSQFNVQSGPSQFWLSEPPFLFSLAFRATIPF